MFKSQNEASRRFGRGRSGAGIVVSQTYKKSTNSEEMSFRVSMEILNKINVGIGDKVDVLFDPDEAIWMIKKDSVGFTVSGKQNGPNGLIRYTLKKGHYRLTKNKDELPLKLESIDESIEIKDDSILFELNLNGFLKS